MDKETRIGILSDWNFWKADRETGINRGFYLNEMERLAKTEQILAITGVRRRKRI